MKLVKIDVICLEQPQRLLKICARVVLHAAVGFAGEEAILAIGRQRRAETLLRVAIAGSDVEVIDSAVDGLCVFRGVRFARAPADALRFRPPQRPEPWDGVRNVRLLSSLASSVVVGVY